jgi:putative ABC transport system permease protein
LGLFGLVSFVAERRTKEIGIRKVIGATVTNVVALLAKELMVLVGVANLIAWPVAYLGMKWWLGNFAYRTDIGFGTFILASLVAVMIAACTISFQSIKGALANPVESLRHE